jgi:hypothetical protein
MTRRFWPFGTDAGLTAWADVSEELVPVRDRGLNLLQRLPVDDQMEAGWSGLCFGPDTWHSVRA